MFSFLILLLDGFEVVIAAVASVVFLVLAGLTLAGSAAALAITTPVFIIFSPVLVPATIATAVLTTGFTAGGILGALAVALIRRRMEVKPTASSAQLELPISGGYGISFGGKSFSGTFGNQPAGGAAPPSGGFGGLWGGKSFPGAITGWFGGTLPAAGGGTPPAAGGGTPPAASGGTPPGGGSKPTW